MSTFLGVAGLIISATLFLIGLGSAIFANSKAKGTESTLKILNDGNDGLRKINHDLQLQRLADREEWGNRLNEQERECTAKISKLEGKIDVMTGGLVQEIVEAVTIGLQEHLRSGS